MSPDELFVSVVSMLLAGWLYVRWAHRIVARGRTLRPPRTWHRVILLAAMTAAPFLIRATLVSLGDKAVQDNLEYLNQYTAMGTAWALTVVGGLRLLGLYVILEALERDNSAVAVAGAGAFTGVALAFAGANVGDGPSWIVVVIAAAIATAGWWVCTWVLARAGGLTELLVVERHLGTGVRMACLWVALGLVLGRAVAGDWVSPSATLIDFFPLAHVAAPLVAIELLFQRALVPYTPSDPGTLVSGALPGVAYVVVALSWLAYLPHPNPTSDVWQPAPPVPAPAL